jgi:hypothetical protein
MSTENEKRIFDTLTDIQVKTAKIDQQGEATLTEVKQIKTEVTQVGKNLHACQIEKERRLTTLEKKPDSSKTLKTWLSIITILIVIIGFFITLATMGKL